jgi:hypothetical protein
MKNQQPPVSATDDLGKWLEWKLESLLPDQELTLEQANKLGETLPELIEQVTSDSAEILLQKYKSDIPGILKKQEKNDRDFQRNLLRLWGNAIKSLEALRQFAFEMGRQFNIQFGPTATKDNDFVFQALIRLHARACLITSEIIALLKSGHASGAHSRWRTLHEIAVVSFFIAQNGNEVAERYLLHDLIESYNAATQYQKKHEQSPNEFRVFGYEPVDQSDLDTLTRLREELCARFGDNFRKNYGWASEALNKSNPNFAELEEAAGFENSRPFYKLASHSVHAQSKGILFNIGLPEDTNLLLTGPSIYGLADPGQGAAYSLHQATYALLMTRENLLNIIIVKAMEKMVQEVQQAFIDAHNIVESE